MAEIFQQHQQRQTATTSAAVAAAKIATAVATIEDVKDKTIVTTSLIQKVC